MLPVSLCFLACVAPLVPLSVHSALMPRLTTVCPPGFRCTSNSDIAPMVILSVESTRMILEAAASIDGDHRRSNAAGNRWRSSSFVYRAKRGISKGKFWTIANAAFSPTIIIPVSVAPFVLVPSLVIALHTLSAAVTLNGDSSIMRSF